MWVLVAIGLLALVAIIGTAQGRLWGPLFIAVGFAGWGVLILISGFRYPFPLIGVVYLMASAGELAAAWEFWQPGDGKGPSVAWRQGAALTGVVGGLASFVLLMWMAGAIVSAMII